MNQTTYRRISKNARGTFVKNMQGNVHVVINVQNIRVVNEIISECLSKDSRMHEVTIRVLSRYINSLLYSSRDKLL